MLAFIPSWATVGSVQSMNCKAYKQRPVFLQNDTNHKITQCEQKLELLNFKAGDK